MPARITPFSCRMVYETNIGLSYLIVAQTLVLGLAGSIPVIHPHAQVSCALTTLLIHWWC